LSFIPRTRYTAFHITLDRSCFKPLPHYLAANNARRRRYDPRQRWLMSATDENACWDVMTISSVRQSTVRLLL